MILKRSKMGIIGIIVFLLSGCGAENPQESMALKGTETTHTVTEENLSEESERAAGESDFPNERIGDLFAEGYTDRELEKMARYYFEMHGGWEYSYPYIKMGTGEDGQVTILLYKEGDEDEHVAVYGNYTVDRRTGKGKDESSGADIDLEETLFFINLEKEYEEKGEEELFFPCIYTDQERFIFSAGEIRGSGRFYYGDFYVYNRKNEVYEAQAHLTDGDTFYVIGENIYYNKYYHNEADEERKGSGLFRTDFSLGHEEKIGEFYSLTKYDREHDLIFAEKRPGKYRYQSSLVIIGRDGTEEKVLYDPKVLDWDFQAGDYICYSHIVCGGRKVYAAVEHWGYRGGHLGWRDILLNRTEIEVEFKRCGNDCETGD